MIADQQLKEMEDRASLPSKLISGRELQLMTDIKTLIEEVRSLQQSQSKQVPPYQAGI